MIRLIDCPSYTERIAPFINKNIIKVLTGQRRKVENGYFTDQA